MKLLLQYPNQSFQPEKSEFNWEVGVTSRWDLWNWGFS